LWKEEIERPWVSTQPLGLAYVAAAAREVGCQTQIIDAYSLGMTGAEVRHQIEAFKPDVVGISALTPQWPDAEKLADIVKSIDADILTVSGGPHVTALPEEAASYPSVDIAVIGEGEQAIAEICTSASTGKALEQIPGIVIGNSDSLIRTPPRERFRELDKLAFPAHDLLPAPAFYNPFPAWGKRGHFSCIISGRGCPYNCCFCDVTSQQGKQYRLRSAENIVDELQWLHQDFGVTTFSFRDPSMICNRRRLMEICGLIGERNLDIVWTCNARTNEVDPEMLQAMKKAGCRLMQYGIEVGNPEMLKKIKNITPERVAQAVSDTMRAGIAAHGYFLFGFIEETAETIEETISFALELDLSSAGFAVMVPFPGTQEFELYKREGLLLTEDWRDYDIGAKPVYRHPNVTEEQLMQATKSAYRRFYLRPKIIARHLRGVTSMQTIRTYAHSARQTLF